MIDQPANRIEVYSVDSNIAAEAIHNPKMADLLRFWREHQPANGIPKKRDFVPEDFKPWFGYLVVLERAGAEDFRYRLYGSELAALLQRDMTGKTVRSHPAVGEFFFEIYDRCLVEAVPIYTLHAGFRRVPVRVWVRLLLPFADDDGEPAYIVAAVYPMEYADAVDIALDRVQS